MFVPDLVVNLVSPGTLLQRVCKLEAWGDTFTVVKGNVNLFGGKVKNN